MKVVRTPSSCPHYAPSHAHPQGDHVIPLYTAGEYAAQNIERDVDICLQNAGSASSARAERPTFAARVRRVLFSYPSIINVWLPHWQFVRRKARVLCPTTRRASPSMDRPSTTLCATRNFTSELLLMTDVTDGHLHLLPVHGRSRRFRRCREPEGAAREGLLVGLRYHDRVGCCSEAAGHP